MPLRVARGVGIVLGTLALAVLFYVAVLRPWQLRWGATDEDLAALLPGDDVVTSPQLTATRAITVNAPPDVVWPWIVQMGSGRAGWYSLDWIDNDGRASACEVLPAFQTPGAGDKVRMMADGPLWMFVSTIVPGRHLLLWDGLGATTFVFALVPIDGGAATRVIARLRVGFVPHALWKWFRPVIEAGDFLFQRKMLTGLRDRAEGDVPSPEPGWAEAVLWFLALLVAIAAGVGTIACRRWTWPAAVFVAAFVAFVHFLFGQPPIVIGLLIDALLCAGLVMSLRRNPASDSRTQAPAVDA